MNPLRRAIVIILGIALGSACNRDALPATPEDLTAIAMPDLTTIALPDLGAHPQPDFGASAFSCGDPTSAHAELNGMYAISPAVSARELFLNCCEGASVDLISMQLATPLRLMWEQQVGNPGPPITLDLASLPKGWSVTVQNCGGTSFCTPTDSYTSGLTGTLTITGAPGQGYTMTACVSAVEDPGSPHPVIHDLRMWVPPTHTQ